MSAKPTRGSWCHLLPHCSFRWFPTPHRSGTTWTLEVVTGNGTYVLADLCQPVCLKLLYELREAGEDRWEPVLARWARELDEELRAYERGEFPDGTPLDKLDGWLG